MSRWLVVSLLLSGCAFSLDGPKLDRPRNMRPRCDTSKALVAVDGTTAGVLGFVALALAGADVAEVALIPAAIGAVYIGGAISGNKNVNQCRAAMEEFDSAYERQQVLPESESAQEPPMRTVSAANVAPPGMAPAPQVTAPSAPVQQPAPAAPASAAPPAPAAPPQGAPAKPASPAKPSPAKQAKGAPPPEPQEGQEWTDFWREVTP